MDLHLLQVVRWDGIDSRTEMMTQFLSHPVPDLLFLLLFLGLCLLHGSCASGSPHHESRHNLPVPLVRKADDADVFDCRVGEQAIFDFERVDVFAAADDEVFDAAGDFEVALGIHEGFVARLCCVLMLKLQLDSGSIDPFCVLKIRSEGL